MSTSLEEPAAYIPSLPECNAPPFIDPHGEEPIRAELFGLDHLEAHARKLAAAAVLTPRSRVVTPLLRRFAENGRVLIKAHRRIVEDPIHTQPRSLEAEWLTDNFHIIEDTLREVEHDLPGGYYSELPKLADGPLAGYPRVFALALALVAHSDSGLDEPRISRYVEAFQSIAPMNTGELWAVPTMLRLALVENLRRIAEQVLRSWAEQYQADEWMARKRSADREDAAHVEVEGGGEAAESTAKTPAARSATLPPLTEALAVRLLQVLRDQGPRAVAVLAEVEAQLAERGLDTNEVLRREHRRQAASQVSLGNCVTSLRLLSALDWNVFFERHSKVEAVLREDPAGVYAHQEFATRDRYRRAVEKIARGSDVDELDVARRAIDLAKAGVEAGGSRAHVGYYLIDAGRAALEAHVGFRPKPGERLLDLVLKHPRASYFGSIAALTAALIALTVLPILSGGGAVAAWQWALLPLVLLLPVSELAVGIVNHLVTLILPPRTLPKIDFKAGISPDCATFVVMPTMLVRPESARALLDRLETHHLANPDPQLRFAILTDFADAPNETMPEDEGYVRSALEVVKALNERYSEGGPDKFFVFHRRRLWNPVQGCWMGWERKRGKLSEFNRLLLGARDTSYAVISGDLSQLPPIRFVITLDADTQVTRDTARRLVGTIAHPLNQPRFDPKQGRVVEGHGVLQPRVSYHLTAATRSRFAAILAASGGIDPYANAVSDTYMDLFGAGTFTGKGIYDVAAFEAATGQTFPENQILSHDLIEGNYARCGLVTDIEMFDDFPARYHAYARREHRWVRGDWQLLPWLGRRVPTSDGTRDNPLPAPERWKIFDNLRRSLVPPALVVLLVLGWTVLPGSPWLFTLLALAVVALPVLKQFVGVVVVALKQGAPKGIWQARGDLWATAQQVLLSLASLSDQARLSVDATVRTLARHLVSRRNLLEWETAAAAERRLGVDLPSFVASMWPASAVALAIGLAVAWAHPAALAAAGPILAAWFFSPVVAWWVSRPLPAVESPLSDDERNALRRIARRTWHFFETFVGDEDHWLPPDNYQEEPEGRVAHRTSPTNMGLLLLSTLSAHDFGYIGLRTLLRRLEKTFETLDKLPKHRGHFLNWYDTRTLSSLHPPYVSTVDSGNLLGCLVTLRQGLYEKVDEPIVGPALRRGLADSLGVVADVLRGLRRPSASEPAREFDALEADLRELGRRLEADPGDLLGWDDWLGKLDWSAVGLLGRVRTLTGAVEGAPEGLEPWTRRFAAQIRDRRAELAAIAPWLAPLRALEEDLAARPTPTDEFARRWPALRAELVSVTGVAAIAARSSAVLADLDALERSCLEVAGQDRIAARLAELTKAVRESAAADLRDLGLKLAGRADAFAGGMDFAFLYKAERHLFSIGCNLLQGRLDDACYDLLASEACLSSYLAIARGDVPRRHWFQLSRPYTKAAGRIGLLSWGGTMFEFLMPRLLLKSLPGTVVAEACRTAVDRQIEYGLQRGVPWGISESSYADFTVDGEYHYQAFGTPGLGLKRGLARDLVIAPYATALAVMIQPHRALENFRRMASEGGEGAYGFYEAMDYTPERVPRGRRVAVVRSYMAHHQGMSLVALANATLDETMPRRFLTEPMVRAVELLLQERVPRGIPLVESSEEDEASAEETRGGTPLKSRRLITPDTPAPRTHLLANGTYGVMLTNAGSGYSTCQGLILTRWREDATRDCWGQFVYLRDLASGVVWSAGYQPTCRAADEYEVTFSADKVAFRRLDEAIEARMEVTVSPESPAEVRRIALTNRDTRPRDLELTSFAEVALAQPRDDLAHPAFGKLFLETEWVPSTGALLCRRRPRAPEQKPIWAVHVSATDRPSQGDPQFETDRARFLGRGRTAASPLALDPEAALSGSTGAVLDPIFSLRRRVRIEPGGTAVVAFTTAFAHTRHDALSLADQFREIAAVDRTFELSWAHCQVENQLRRWSPEETHIYQRLAAHIIYAGSALRAPAPLLIANHQGVPALWRSGISGDLPIVLVRVAGPDELDLARQLLVAHDYLRLKGLLFDLVILDEEPVNSHNELSRSLSDLIRVCNAQGLTDRPGGVFLRTAGRIPDEDKVLLQAAARVVLIGDRGPLASQLDRIERPLPLPEALATTRGRADWQEAQIQAPPDLLFDNGLGGFTPDGREYRMSIRGTARDDSLRNGRVGRGAVSRPILPPAPWINVVANPSSGFLVSESGSGYTWAANSQANRLTPWNNDPVSDALGEVVYLRDEASGEVWCPTPLPVPSDSTTLVRHGQGYTAFERQSHALSHELLLFVPPDDPIKLIRLRVSNPSDRPRHLSATFFAEWVLGTLRDQAPMQVVTEVDPESGALLARNAFNLDQGAQVAFADVSLRPRTVTADRAEFLGRNHSPARPAALGRVELSGRTGAALDPCAAIQAKFDLAPGERKEVVFMLGQTGTPDEVRRLVEAYRDPQRVEAALEEVRGLWDRILTAVQVRTPNPAMDLMLNRWLLYQALGCRIWARSALYQSGGAYGFRDQLQDAMALVYGAPEEARAHLLRAASRQFLEGDVQHWWHPPTGRGVRTHFSDDFLWLPYVVCHYVATTGDQAVLDETVPYLKAPLLRPGQEDDYGLPATAEESGTLYDHCVRALEHGLRFGAHGLPLMGTGDWNDGMNRVGSAGRGESVWDAWFLLTILGRFAELAESRGDAARVAHCRDEARRLREAVESRAWDGCWYRRAYFDDGTPLGSEQNDECRIDSLAQTWAVISGAADPERARRAMEAVEEHLVRDDDGLILLFTPPFDRGTLQPGYIKGYVPGIRENDGQYTHAATWVVLATALLGRGRRASELFDLLNPIHHASDPESTARYKVEPYVVAADIYGRPPHTGRGGWTWYTGSASWLYRVGLEALLGFRLRGTRLLLDPCIPGDWPGFEITYRHRSTIYHIAIENPDGVERGVRALTLDGRPLDGDAVDLADDGQVHEVRVTMGARPSPTPPTGDRPEDA